MAEYQVVETDSGTDLGDFSRFLWQKNVSHRIVTQGDKQYLLVGNEHDAVRVATAYRSLAEGELKWPEADKVAKEPRASLLAYLTRLPVTLIVIFLSLIGYCLVLFEPRLGVLDTLTFFQLIPVDGKLAIILPKQELWRLLTPIFLHFSILHITFNMLWFWFFGLRIEALQGSGKLLAVVLLTGLGSNLIQAMYSVGVNFGGMSGVVYGLLGYAMVWDRLQPQSRLHVPQMLYGMMLFFLVLNMFGFAQLFGEGKVANAAHVGGLIMGCLIGLGAAFIAGKKT